MIVRIAFMLLAFFTANIFSQSISFSKDSLNLVWNNDNFTISDTTWVFNIGNSDLIIDSILTKNQLGYRILSSSLHPSESYLVGYDKPPINLTIASGDSVEMIFTDPDLCPICKESSVKGNFTDTLIFASNSISGRYYMIDVRGDGPTSVTNDYKPLSIELYQNYPNPFNPTTIIAFSLKESSKIKLIIYDILGNIIEVLADGKFSVGKHEIEFDGKYLSNGIYFYRLITGKSIQTKKLVLLK